MIIADMHLNESKCMVVTDIQYNESEYIFVADIQCNESKELRADLDTELGFSKITTLPGRAYDCSRHALQ